MKVVGLDLAGKQENDTGLCFIEGSSVKILTVRTDVEIMEIVKTTDPDIIAVDAPLGFPEEGMYRDCDQKLKDMGYDVLSPNFPGMRVLVNRARSLVGKLSKMDGYDIIEVFSQASEDILPARRTCGMSEDEFDAFVCALTAKKYLEGEYKDMDGIVLPED